MSPYHWLEIGCREQEACKLRWEWEVRGEDLRTSVFLMLAGFGGRSDRAGVKDGVSVSFFYRYRWGDQNKEYSRGVLAA